MKVYKLFVTDKRSKEKYFIEFEEKSKKNAIQQAHGNGYIVHNCFEKDFYNYMLDNTDCEYWKVAEYKKEYKEGKK